MINNVKSEIKINSYEIVLQIKQYYNFLLLDEPIFNRLAVKAAIHARQAFDGTIENFKKILNNTLIDLILKQIKLELKKKEPIVLLSAIMDNIFTKYQSINDIIMELTKLDEALTKIEFNFTPELANKILEKNIKLQKFMEAISDNFNILCQNNIIYTFSTLEQLTDYNEQNDIIFSKKNQYDDFTIDITLEYLNSINKPLLTNEEFEVLFKKYKNGDNKAKETLVERNLRLVVALSKQYKNKGLPLLDLIQEGNLGLMKAIEKYDPAKGSAFSTYAAIWINQAIRRAVAITGRNIKTPVHIHNKLCQYSKTKYLLAMKLHREPSEFEIAEALKVDVKEVRYLEKIQYDTLSLSTLLNFEEEIELEKFVLTDDTDFVETTIVTDDMRNEVIKLLHKCNLTQKELEVILTRFELEEREFGTFKTIGEKLNVSRARAGQLEQRAMHKIKNSKSIKKLAVYMDDPNKALQKICEYQKQKRKRKQI